MFVDSHCHLAFPEYDGRIDAIRAEMARAQVEAALVICTTLEEFPRVHALALAHDDFWASAGVHPDSSDGEEPSVERLVDLAQRPRVVAVGETGLDYYRLGERTRADMAWQRERFVRHIRAARQAGRPLIVHTRAAADDTVALMREEGAERAGGVFHCFTETLDVARHALDMGFMVSFSGIVSFRNAEALREVARFVPLERCLIETDSPYLAPVPHRGKTNQPAWVAQVAEAVAAAKGVSVAEVARSTTANFRRLFGIPAPAQHAA
ncbi:MAG: TatD family hydrolase [Burkholderiaceae bacterium]